jgi:hypothetical protein
VTFFYPTDVTLSATDFAFALAHNERLTCARNLTVPAAPLVKPPFPEETDKAERLSPAPHVTHRYGLRHTFKTSAHS